jgi:hypothetical protein
LSVNTHRHVVRNPSHPLAPAQLNTAPAWLILIGLGCALLPMTGMKGPSFMGELSRTASVWFFIPGIVLSLTKESNKSDTIIFLFGSLLLSWIIISGIINMPNIITSELRGRTGLSRFITTTAVVIYGLLVSTAISRVPKHLSYRFVIIPIMLGVYISAAVGIIEVTWWYAPTITPLYQAVVNLVRPGFPHLDFWGRLTSVGFEPHALGLWLGFAFPIALWGLSSPSGRRNRMFWALGLALVIGMLVLSDGRAGLVTSTVVFCVWITTKAWPILFPHSPYPTRTAITSVMLMFFAVLAFQLVRSNSLGDELIGGDISNLSRYAMNVSAYEMVPDAPIAGRGMGQYAFWSDKYIPPWGWKSYEVRAWLIESKNGWPSTFSLPGRILSELGIIGFIFWYIGIYILLIISTNQSAALYRHTTSSRTLMILLLTPFLFFSGLANESFAQIGFWVAIALCLKDFPSSDRSA